MALAFVPIASWNVDAQVDVEEINLVIELPAPLGAWPVERVRATSRASGATRTSKAELQISALISDPEVVFNWCTTFLAFIERFEDVDGLGEVAVAEELEDVIGVAFLSLNAGVWMKKNKGEVSLGQMANCFRANKNAFVTDLKKMLEMYL